MLLDCIKKLGKQIDTVDKAELEAAYQQHVSDGMSPESAGFAALSGFHKSLHDELTALRKAVKLPAVKYVELPLPSTGVEGGDLAKSIPREIQTETPAFKKWFGDSKVVDADGKPLRVYRGDPSSSDIQGLFFTDNPELASDYAGQGYVTPVYLRLENPNIIEANGAFINDLNTDKRVQVIAAKGQSDGTIIRNVIDPPMRQGLRSTVLEPITVYRVNADTQIKSAIGNHGTFDPSDADITKSISSEPFYSRVESIINKMPDRATPQQVTALLLKNGVKELDPEYQALKVWLEDQGGSVSKADVAEFVAANKIEVEEVVKGEPEYDIEAWWNDEGGANEEKPWSELTNDEIREAGQRYQEEVGDYAESRVHFAQWQLPGESENYREEFIIAPQMDLKRAGDVLDRFIRQFNSKPIPEEHKAEYERLRQAIADAKDESGVWQDGHDAYSDVKNPIVRLRYNDRTTTDGAKMLFAEEFQQPNPENFAKMPKVYQKYGEQMAIRKMLYRAVEGGYDYFGFTTGQQQADRYDLSKQIGVINWHKNENGDGKIRIDALTSDLGTQVINDSFTPDELEGVVGKEIAQRIIDGVGKTMEGERGLERGEMSGLDLKVGGEGLINRYDRKHVDYINKLMKPYGVSVEHHVPSRLPQPQSIRKLSEDFFGSQIASRPLLNVMNGFMVSGLHHDQILKDVVRSLPVNVVDTLVSHGIDPELFTRQPKVFANDLSPSLYASVSLGVSRSLTKTSTRIRTGLSSAFHTGLDKELLPALKASDLSLDESLRILFPEKFLESVPGTSTSTATKARTGAESLTEVSAGNNKIDAAKITRFIDFHDGIIPNHRRVPQVDFERHQIRISPEFKAAVEQSIQDNGGAFPMFRKADEISQAQEDIANARTIPVKELLNRVDPANLINHGDGILEVVDVPEYEILRRLLGSYEAKHTKGFDPVKGTHIDGVFMDAGQVNLLNDIIDERIPKDKSGKLEAIKGIINDVTGEGRGIIILWKDEALAEEKGHRALSEVRTGNRASQVDKATADKILKGEAFQRAMQADFGRRYGTASKPVQLEEFAVKASLGYYDELGARTDEQKRQVASDAVNYIEALATANQGDLTRDEILDKLSKEIAYAEEVQTEQANRAVQKESGADTQSDVDSDRSEDVAQPESRSVPERDGQKERRFQKTLEKTERGIFEPSTYFSDTMEGWKGEAEKIVNEQGIEKATTTYFSDELPQKIKNALGIALVDYYGQSGDLATMNKVATDLIVNATSMGQGVKAFDLANRYDPQSWLFVAAKYKAKSVPKGEAAELTPEDKQKGEQHVTSYTEAADNVTVGDEMIKENRLEAEHMDAEIAAIDRAIREDNAHELEALKKEVESLRNQLEDAKKGVPKASKKIKDVIAKIDRVANRNIIQAFVRADERGSFILSPEQRYQIGFEETGLSENVFNAFRDEAVVKLAEELPKGEMNRKAFHTFLGTLSRNKLSERQRDQIMAAAVNKIRLTKEHEITPEQLRKQQNRREIYKKAYEILGAASKQAAKDATATVKEAVAQGIASPRDIWHKQLVGTAANVGADDMTVIGANVLKTTNNLTKWRNMMHELFPEISRKDFDGIYKKAYDLKTDVTNDLKRMRAEKKAGRVLSDAELAELERIQKKKVSRLMSSRANLEGFYRHLSLSKSQKVGRGIRAVTNAPRTFMTGWDLSFAGRQGMALNAMESIESVKGLRTGLTKGLSEEEFDNILYIMENDPVAQEMKELGWSSRAILKNPLEFEEFYLSNLPMKLADIPAKTRVGKVVGAVPRFVGRGFKASERIFELQGDMQGYNVYKAWTTDTQMSESAKRHLVRVINAATGRGNLRMVFGTGGAVESLLAEVMFSARFLYSRAEFVAYTNPIGVALAPKGARAVLAKKSMKMWGKTAMIFLPLAMLGLTSLDPEDDEFMKVRYGDQSWDITGKLNDPLRSLALSAKAAYYYGMTQVGNEEERKMGESGLARLGAYYADASGWARYFRGKMSPQASLVVDKIMGEDFLGRPFTWTNSLATRMTPLGLQNLWNALVYNEKEAMMRNPVTLQTFATNVDKVAKGKYNENIPRMFFSFMPDVMGVSGASYPREETTTADEHAKYIKQYKGDDTKDEMIEGTPKWRVTSALVRLGRMGYDVDIIAQEYVDKGQLDEKDVKDIKAKAEKLWIEQKMHSATTDQVIDVLRFTTPYPWFMQPFMPKNDKNRAIERERLLKMLGKKADNAAEGKTLTPDELDRVRQVMPEYVPPSQGTTKPPARGRPIRRLSRPALTR